MISCMKKKSVLENFIIVIATVLLICAFFQKDSPLATYLSKTSEKESVKESDRFCITDKKTAFTKLALTLKQHALELLNTQRSLIFSAQHYNKLDQHLKTVNDMLKSLQEDEIQEYNNSYFAGKGTKDIPRNQEVCPEIYMGKSTLYGWPFFRKGFESVNCTDFAPIHKLVTVLVRISKELPKPLESCIEITKGLAKYYPKVRVILATEKAIDVATKSKISNLNVVFENEVIEDIHQGALWKRLLEKVETPYVLIAPHLTLFDDDINLERLVRVLSYEPWVVIAGGSYRNFTGHWDIGCEQVSFRNWTATYMGGYYHSFNECILCDFLKGPWMAKTSTVKSLDFDLNLKYGAFRDLFWRLKKRTSGEIAISCPDIMFNIESRDVRDEELVTFANKHKIHKVVEADGRVRWYGCRRGYPYTSSKLCSQVKGVGLSPADLENVADAVKFFMKECEDAGAYCELSDGTLLGAVKLHGILPWEQDADISFLFSNLSAIEKLKDKLASNGYTLNVLYRARKVIEGRPNYGGMTVRFSGWRIDLFGFMALESSMLTASGRHRTKILFAGQWVNVMQNPGLYARNHYRHEIYKHQEHLRSYGRSDRIWGFYDPGAFFKCPTKGHSACLDQYPADGSMQFSDYPDVVVLNYGREKRIPCTLMFP